jgi:hypothetical protein
MYNPSNTLKYNTQPDYLGRNTPTQTGSDEFQEEMENIVLPIIIDSARLDDMFILTPEVKTIWEGIKVDPKLRGVRTVEDNIIRVNTPVIMEGTRWLVGSDTVTVSRNERHFTDKYVKETMIPGYITATTLNRALDFSDLYMDTDTKSLYEAIMAGDSFELLDILSRFLNNPNENLLINTLTNIKTLYSIQEAYLGSFRHLVSTYKDLVEFRKNSSKLDPALVLQLDRQVMALRDSIINNMTRIKDILDLPVFD